MQSVIDGKLYDTENATRIAVAWPNGIRDMGDFNYCKEELYVTDSQSYFIMGEGGARSKYSQPGSTGGRTGGKEIDVKTEEEAFDWCQRHDKVEAIQEHFADRIELA
jgi:hypothetical protein